MLIGKHLKNVMGLLVTVCLLSVASGQAEDGAPARSVIFFIGDGMGPQIVSIVKLYAERSLGRDLNMVQLANTGTTGYMTTHAEDRMVTDSAASGTAMATGHKTNNGVVGMTPDGEVVANLFKIKRFSAAIRLGVAGNEQIKIFIQIEISFQT